MHVVAPSDVAASSTTTGLNFGDFSPNQFSSTSAQSLNRSDVVTTSLEPDPEGHFSWMVWDTEADFGLGLIGQPAPTGPNTMRGYVLNKKGVLLISI